MPESGDAVASASSDNSYLLDHPGSEEVTQRTYLPQFFQNRRYASSRSQTTEQRRQLAQGAYERVRLAIAG